MLIIGCDFHPGFEQVAIFDNLTGETRELRLGHREECGTVLSFSERTGAGGDGGVRALSVVRALVGRVGARVVVGGCGEDSGLGSAPAEDGSSGCVADFAVAARGAFSEDVARGLELRATVPGRCAGEPESFRGWNEPSDCLSEQPASPMSGEFETKIMAARAEEMDAGA